MISQQITSKRTDLGEMIPHIVQTACTFKSSITFEVDDKHVNAKSIMGVMALASQNNPHIVLCVNGLDEEEALEAMKGLLEE